jgi:hypothetical protein
VAGIQKVEDKFEGRYCHHVPRMRLIRVQGADHDLNDGMDEGVVCVPKWLSTRVVFRWLASGIKPIEMR